MKQACVYTKNNLHDMKQSDLPNRKDESMLVLPTQKKSLLKKWNYILAFCLAMIFSSSLFAFNLNVTGITESPYTDANGIYISQGTLNGAEYWKHQTKSYYIYYAPYSGGGVYWNLDVNTEDEDNLPDANGVIASSTSGEVSTAPPIGISFNSGSSGFTSGFSITIAEYSTVPEIDISGNGNSITSGDNTPSFADYTKFASTNVSGGASTRTYTIYNTGTVDALTVGTITIGGTNAADFTVTTLPASTVSHGSSTTFTITFNPSSSGEKTAMVSIVNNDSNENPYTFTISGYGYTPKNLVVSGITSPSAANGTYTHQGVSGDFQYWKHSTQNYYIYYSLSSRNWIISNTSTTGGTWYFYSFSDLYSPTGLTYSLSSGTGTVSVNEEVAVPNINIKVGAYTISNGSSTTLYNTNTNFGSLEVASGTRAKSYTIENTGNATLTLSGTSPYFTITGTNASDFSVATIPSNSILASGTTTFGITFNPSAAGTRTATVTVSSNDADKATYTFAIKGEGVNPRNLVVSNITAPAAANGTYIYQGLLNEFQYWKHSTQNYYIYNSKLNGIDPVWYIDVNTSADLYTPSSYNFYSQTDYVSPVSVSSWTSSSGNSGTPTIQYTEPEINVTGNSINIICGDATPSIFDFTDLGWVVSGSISKTFNIQNTGIATLNLTGTSPYITFSGANASQFSITSIPSPTIAAGSSTTFGVTFTPSSGTLGARTATLSIANDDTNENPYTFLVQSGVGTLPVVTTQTVSNIGTTNAIGNGNITTLGSPNPTSYGICYGTTSNPDVTGSKVDKGTASATGAFTAQLTGLTLGTIYHVRAFATNNVGTVYGSDQSFTTTSSMTEPGNALNFDGSNDYVVTTDNDNSLTAFTIEAWVKWTPSATTDIQFICGKGVAQMEIHTGGDAGANGLRFIPTTNVWLDATNVLPTGIWTHVAAVYNPSASLAKMYINGVEVTLVNHGSNPLSTAITNTATPFYLGSRSDGTYRFKGSMDEVRVWSLVRSQSDIQADMVNAISASSSGLINYYNFNEGTTGSTMLPDLTSNGNNGTLTNFALTGTTSNWVESYAMVVPTATAASSLTVSGFTANWTAPATGTVTNYKLYVATDAAFTSLVAGYNPLTVASTSTSSAVTGLSANATYYYRIRADKTSVTGEGARSNTISLTTLKVPTVTTQAVTSILTTTATGNGNITDLGNPATTSAYGICWKTSTGPVATDNHTDGGIRSTTGAFTGSMTSLTAGATYYVRAYATNTGGTAYGDEVSFTALNVPTVTTQAVSNIGTTNAIGNGTITDLGVPNPTAYGVCWNTTGTPTISDSKTDNGAATATGAFTASMTSLTANTTYYVRAFSTNTVATSYGTQVSFTTLTNGTFTAASNNDWATATNWAGGSVPTSATDVTIPSGKNPVIGAITTASCNNLTVIGSLTIQSSSSGTGSLIVSGTSTGTVTAERYMTGGMWHMVSPIAAGSSISTFIQAPGNAIPLSGSNYGMMDYNETTNLWKGYYTSSTSENFTAGKGYGLRRSSDGVVTFTGMLTSGTNTVAITKGGTEGWNLIGNPYTSSIYMNTAANSSYNFLKTNAIDASKLDPSYACIYLWDVPSSTYKILGNTSYSGRDLGMNVFAPGQAFFVKAASPGTVEFNKNMQVHQTGSTFKAPAANVSWPGMTLTATSAAITSSTVITFNGNMTNGLDPTYDAGLLRGTNGLSLYTRLVEDNGVDFAIQCLPENYNNLVIPVGIDCKAGGDITFSAENITLPIGCNVVLEDKTTGISTSLTGAAIYKATLPAETNGIGRFYIRTDDTNITGTSGLNEGIGSLKAYYMNGSIIIKGEVSDKAIASLYNLQGIKVLVHSLQKRSLNILSCPELMNGIYLLTILQNGDTLTRKLILK